MTSYSKLPSPLNTFHVEKKAGEYKDFGDTGTYPLKGVTYPVDYGDIQGYNGEDGANLDFFVGEEKDGLCGYIKVYRPELKEGEHKFYIQLSDKDEAAILYEFKPVVLSHHRYQGLKELIDDLEAFKI